LPSWKTDKNHDKKSCRLHSPPIFAGKGYLRFSINADEMAIGMVNNKTTAVRVIPVPGKTAGDWVEFGGLLGGTPILPVHSAASDAFIARGGRIPAPIHSFRN
jgi:uncharacterized protein (UPF0210 family)